MDDWTTEELERFRELMERANRELEDRNEMSKETSDELKSFKDRLRSAGQNTERAMGQLSNAFTSWVGSVQRGDRGAAVMATAFNDVSGSAGELLSSLGPLGKAAGLVTKAFGRVALAAAEQADAQYNAYRGLQQFGAAANDGLTGLQKNLEGLGLTVDQLENMVQMIGNQSVPLAMFAGTVADARQQLADIGLIMENTGLRENLMRLGMSSADISEAMINFVALQSEVGAAQKMDQFELANATGSYLKEMNALTKATGVQRDAAEEQVRQLRQQERFRAYVDTLRARGQTELANSAERAVSVFSELVSPEAARGLADILAGGGAISSREAQRLLLSTGMSQEGIQEIVSEFQGGTLEVADFIQRVTASLGETGERLRQSGLPQVGALEASGAYLDYSDLSRSRVLSEENIAEAVRKSTIQIEEQTNTTEDGVDALVRLNRAQIEQSQSISDMIESFTGVNTTLADFQERAADAAEALASIAGAGTTSAGTGGKAGIADGGDESEGGPGGGSSGFQLPPGIGAGGTAGEMRSSARSSYDTQGISELIDTFSNRLRSGQDVSINDLIETPEGRVGNWAEEIANYMGISASQSLQSSPETIGKMVMGLMGKQTTGNPAGGEKYRDDIRRFLKQEFGDVGEFRHGGIAKGPKSGYFAELHGTEAVVPLSGGSIPVTISNLESQISGPIQQLSERMNIAEDLITNTRNQQQDSAQTRTVNSDTDRRSAEQIGALRDQITRLDRLIQVSQSNNNIMSKILQNSYA